MMRTTARVARNRRICDSCKRGIGYGERFLEHVASPRHGDLGNPGWWRIAECAECATRYGRRNLIAAGDGAGEATPE